MFEIPRVRKRRRGGILEKLASRICSVRSLILRLNSELAMAACNEGGIEEAGLGEEGDGAGLVFVGMWVEMLPEGEYGMGRDLLQAEDWNSGGG